MASACNMQVCIDEVNECDDNCDMNAVVVVTVNLYSAFM